MISLRAHIKDTNAITDSSEYWTIDRISGEHFNPNLIKVPDGHLSQDSARSFTWARTELDSVTASRLVQGILGPACDRMNSSSVLL
jgi:hypothetical protein